MKLGDADVGIQNGGLAEKLFLLDDISSSDFRKHTYSLVCALVHVVSVWTELQLLNVFSLSAFCWFENRILCRLLWYLTGTTPSLPDTSIFQVNLLVHFVLHAAQIVKSGSTILNQNIVWYILYVVLKFRGNRPSCRW